MKPLGENSRATFYRRLLGGHFPHRTTIRRARKFRAHKLSKILFLFSSESSASRTKIPCRAETALTWKSVSRWIKTLVRKRSPAADTNLILRYRNKKTRYNTGESGIVSGFIIATTISTMNSIHYIESLGFAKISFENQPLPWLFFSAFATTLDCFFTFSGFTFFPFILNPAL